MITPLRVRRWLAFLVGLVILSACEKRAPVRQGIEISTRHDRTGARIGTDEKRDTTADLAHRINNSHPEEFDKLWEDLQESPASAGEKRLLYESLLQRISALGRVDLAIAAISARFGSGGMRVGLIKAVFASSHEPADRLLAMRDKLPSAEDRQAAAAGIRSMIGNRAELSHLDASSFQARGEEGIEILVGGMANYVKVAPYKGRDPALAFQETYALVVKIDEEGSGKSVFLNRFLEDAAQTVPFAVWKVIGDEGAADQTLLNAVVREMAGSDAAKAMLAVAGSTHPHMAGVVAAGWLGYDLTAAEAWYRNDGGNLPPDARNEVTKAFALFAAQKADFSKARSLIEAISTPEQKANAEGAIWGLEREAVRRDIYKNPEDTLNSMIGQQSKYADYWLEEAMATWMAKDFDKSNGWYQRNWKSLPADKAQYVAAAFANQAVSQGDTTTARQWSALIQDPKTKQRIEAGIAKAESKPKP